MGSVKPKFIRYIFYKNDDAKPPIIPQNLNDPAQDFGACLPENMGLNRANFVKQ